MTFIAAVLTLCAGLAPEGDAIAPGPNKINVQTASLNKVPSTTRGLIRELKKGEEVNVLSVEGNYAKVKASDGAEGFVAKSALIASKAYTPSPTNEQEMAKAKAEGYEAGRFDPETENKYKKDKGPEMDKAYKGVDDWEARQIWATQRTELSKRLDGFRKEGKLAEYSNVK